MKKKLVVLALVITLSLSLSAAALAFDDPPPYAGSDPNDLETHDVVFPNFYYSPVDQVDCAVRIEAYLTFNSETIGAAANNQQIADWLEEGYGPLWAGWTTTQGSNHPGWIALHIPDYALEMSGDTVRMVMHHDDGYWWVLYLLHHNTVTGFWYFEVPSFNSGPQIFFMIVQRLIEQGQTPGQAIQAATRMAEQGYVLGAAEIKEMLEHGYVLSATSPRTGDNSIVLIGLVAIMLASLVSAGFLIRKATKEMATK